MPASRSTPPSSELTSTALGPVNRGPGRELVGDAFGRSCGGLTTKIHLAADSHCRPLAFVLTPGQAGDVPAFTQVMTLLRGAPVHGRPRSTPDVALAD